MSRRKEIKKTVYRILQEDEYARGNDNYLIMRVVQQLESDLAGTSFANVMQNITFKGISCESITRARRDWGKEYPELKIDKVERARRKKEEEYYLEYSKHIPHI